MPKRRTNHNAGTAWILWLALLLGAGAVAYWYAATDQASQWPVKHIQIQGDLAHLDKTELQQQVAAMVGDSFFRVDMAAVRDSLLVHPWIVAVGVRRVWPDTLRVSVAEQQPIARWLTPTGKPGLLNQQGVVFQPDKIPPMPHLPLLQGSVDDAVEIVHFYRLIRARADQNDLAIAKLHRDMRNAWHVHFSNGLHVLLGQSEYQQRWQNFMRIYPKLKAYAEPQRIDMRYAHGVAVRWQQAVGEGSVVQMQLLPEQQGGDG